MGRKRPSSGGVEVRTYASGKQAIRVHFMYRGVECRETLKGLKVTAPNLKHAAALKATIDHEIVTGTFDYLARFPTSKKARRLGGRSAGARLKDLEDEYRADIRRRYQKSTQFAYLQPFDAWVLPTFGQVTLGEIDAPMIRRALKELAGRGLKSKTVGNYKTALNLALDYAVDHGYLEVNPALAVQASRVTGQDGGRKEDVDPFTQGEVKAILAAADKMDERIGRYLAFAFYSGLRTSELFGLRWGDVDWDRRSVLISRAVVHGELKPMPKTAAGVRDVLLLDPAYLALKNQRAATQLLPHQYVFINPFTGEPFRRYRETSYRWRLILKAAGVRYRNQYQTRHTYASHLLSGGENPYFVARQLGHKNVQMVMRVYGRWIEQAGRLQDHVWVSDYGSK